MLRIPDLVRDSRLDTQFHPEYTKHIYYETGLTPRQRKTRRDECWKWKRYIGQGSYGSVWLEQCVGGQREIEFRAVKKIPKLQQRSKPIDYNRELEAIAKFSHWRYERCFVKSFGWYESAEAVFITMEYFQHGDLQDYLSSAPPLPVVEAQQITSQILEGLSFMHDNGFAHRDLKPRNILVRSTPPEHWWVKIGDFGISKRAEEGLTMSSTLKGTLAFLAPELHGFVKAGNESSPRSAQAADMWSLGETVFRMLTGEPTFKTMGLLADYVQMPDHFPSNALLARGVRSEGCDFIKRVMMPTSGERLTAKDALLHDWMEPDTSPGLGPSSPVFESSPAPQGTSTSIVADLISEPSARWSTLDDPVSQSTPSTQRTPDVARANGTYSLPSRTVNNLNKAQGIQNQRTSEPADATQKTRAKSEEQPSMFRNERRWEEAEELDMQATERRERLLAQEHSDTLRTTEDLAAVYHTQRWYDKGEPLDGKLVASASFDKTVRLWDSATGTACKTLKGHWDLVRAVAFSPDGKLVASASDDKTVRLWNSATGKARKTLKGHSDLVMAVAFSPDSKLVASASYDKTVRLWDSATGTARKTLEGHSYWVTAVAFSPDGKLVASASYDKTVRLWDSATGTVRKTLEGHSHPAMAVAFSPDGKLVASASFDKTVRLWDSATGTTCKTLEGHSYWVTAVAFSPDGKLVASASFDKTVRLWDSATGKARKTLKGHSDQVRAVAFSPDGKLVASASYDKTVRLWDSATGTACKTLEGHSDLVMAVAFSPDGKLVASASYDETVRLWSSETGTARKYPVQQ